MSHQATNVAKKLRQNSMVEREFYRDKEFFCYDIIEEDWEENCCDNFEFVATMIKVESKEAVSRQYNLGQDIKS